MQCYGSPFFLKKRFGQGYTLHVSKGEDFRQIERCSQIISSKISEWELMENNEQEVTYRLDNGQSAKFPEMFLELERNKEELDIVNFGLDLTTMDDVFLKIGELQEKNVAGEEASMISDNVNISHNCGILTQLFRCLRLMRAMRRREARASWPSLLVVSSWSSFRSTV